jgi:hypothetical protein
MKMAQVARAISRGIGLNQDFTEAIALGAKVGAVPFIHASKHSVGTWIEEKISKLDSKLASSDPIDKNGKKQLDLDFNQREIPNFVTRLQSSAVFGKVQRFMPWAAGDSSSKLYSSGQESYWLLCTNPFINQAKKETHFPETMYGIWRHTRGLVPSVNPFVHRCKLNGSDRGFNEIADKHATFENIVVQYADDITWAIENLNDANDVALLNHQSRGVYEALADELPDQIDPSLQRALVKNDAGGIYTYFISDFVRHSSQILTSGGNGPEIRDKLTKGAPEARIGLSKDAEDLLERMISFLRSRIFTEPRTKNRTEMLRSISSACIELIYSSGDVLPRVLEDQSRLGRWNEDTKKLALDLLNDEVHRIQLSLDVLASWTDQEIYDFVGIQSL